MGQRPQCKIPSFVGISPLIPEIFEGVLPNKGMAAILVICETDAVNKLLFTLPMEVPHKIWL